MSTSTSIVVGATVAMVTTISYYFGGCYQSGFFVDLIAVHIELVITYFGRYRNKKRVEIVRMKVMMQYILMGGSIIE